MFGTTSLPAWPPDSRLAGPAQPFLRGFTVSTVPSTRGFSTNAETLSPYPDGVCVRVPRSCSPNPTLLGTTTSAAYRARARPHLPPLPTGSPGEYRKQLPQRCGGGSPVAGALLSLKGHDGENDVGYWSVLYVTAGGEMLGATKLPDPRGRGPLTFERVVGAIEENAALLRLRVSYITYFDTDFDAYVLLTHRTAQKCSGHFRVVVASGSEAAAKAPAAKAAGESRRDDAPQSCNEAVGASPRQLVGLSRAPKAHSRQEHGTNAAGAPAPEHLLAQRTLLFQAEAARREAIVTDEESWRLIIQAMGNTRITFWPRGL
ncbi:putative microtubule-associated protein Gb4 [Trypanosoma conorhini]|uniref:Putative microtubule-associated protein Gb4 n=1 Tax=Trypanosoma conorhini TaxID=83891 RepID=A0A3R7ML47_9TRYP|nr:putative microtubule-associated protein Gb4 [Trypanosoma conorhini]RNF04491.1 putative microtubule-associated protein Gb4 [Trypanosoma conorhini]